MPKISLKAARVNKGLTQKEAAMALGVGNKTLWMWENSVSMPKADKIDAICELYGVPYDNIIFLTRKTLKAFQKKGIWASRRNIV